MTEDAKTEEKSPLLLYINESENEKSKNNKRVNFDKGRLYGITSGAATVFSDFPSYLTPCWFTTVFSLLLCCVMGLLIMISSMDPMNLTRLPRCIKSAELLDNKTIHLVHSYNWTPLELELLGNIKRSFEGYKVHLTLIDEVAFTPNATTHAPKLIKQALMDLKRTRRKRKAKKEVGVGFGMKALLDILLRGGTSAHTQNLTNFFNITEVVTTPQPQTLDQIRQNFPDLSVENTTIDQAFQGTPLELYYRKLDLPLQKFAIQILHLWQYGGLTFQIDTDKVFQFIETGKTTYENLPEELVTADDEGLHVFTKTPCHAFFGEVILRLRHPRRGDVVRSVMRRALKVFCRHYAVGGEYCKGLIKSRV